MEGVIPDKSRSLRKTSVKKRLETEGKRKQPKSKDKRSKKARLSKYRRKSANAKERERMKKQNDVFEVLKGMVPCDKLGKTIDEDKETKVTTLRAAIVYINSLKSLLADCEAGRLDSEVLRDCALTSPAGAEVKARRKSPTKRKVSSKKCDKVQPKWINYSKQDLRTKFDPKGVSDAQSPTTPPPSYTLPISSPQPYTLPTQNIPPPPPYQTPTIFCSSPTDSTTYLCQAPTIFIATPTLATTTSTPCPSYVYATTTSDLIYTDVDAVQNQNCGMTLPMPSSPRDVNEISLHISLLDSRTQLVTF